MGPIRLGVLARLCGELLKFLDERYPCVDQLAGVVEVPEVGGPQCRLFGDTFERLGVGVVVTMPTSSTKRPAQLSLNG